MSEAEPVLIIETLGFDPGQGFIRIERHLDRAERTADDMGYEFDRLACRRALDDAVADQPLRCRLTIDPDGRIEVATGPLAPVRSPWIIAVARPRLNSGNIWLRRKTSNRRLYDQARAMLPVGIHELIFFNEKNELCEGSITNIFIRLNGHLWTPPLSSGLLPGVLRQALLESGDAKERVLTLEDLHRAQGVFVGNSLRGLIPAVLTRM